MQQSSNWFIESSKSREVLSTMGKKVYVILEAILLLSVAIHLVYCCAVPNRSRRQADRIGISMPVLNCSGTSAHTQDIGKFNDIFLDFRTQIYKNEIVR